MNKVIIVAMMISLTVIWNDHVAGDSREQRNDALADNLLQVLSLHECSEQLDEVLGHPMNSLAIIILGTIVTFISSLGLVLLCGFHICEEGLVTTDFSVDWDMLDEELPGGREDHAKAISGVVDEVPEYHCQTL